MIPTTMYSAVQHASTLRSATVQNLGDGIGACRRDCARCSVKAQCLPQRTPFRRVHIVKNHAAILHARRKRAAWGTAADADACLYPHDGG